MDLDRSNQNSFNTQFNQFNWLDFLCLNVWVISIWQEDILVQTKKQKETKKTIEMFGDFN